MTDLGGFTGRYLKPELEGTGYEVSCPMDDRDRAIDLLDAEGLAQAVGAARSDMVVHLAGISFAARADVDAMYRVNIVGTHNLLAALAAGPHEPRSVPLASNATIYGNAAAAFIDEDTPNAPANDYAVSKPAMEHMARVSSDRLSIVIARPFNYRAVGQCEHYPLPKIVAHFSRLARVIELGNLDIERDFSNVCVVAHCYARLIEAGRVGKIYNVCSGRSHTLVDILAMMARISGYMREIRVNTAFVCANEVKRLHASRHKLDEVIGAIEDIPLMDTLRWMYEADT